MAWTRFAQSGFEMGRASELPFSDGSLPPETFSGTPITGDQSWEQTGKAGLGYFFPTEPTQVRGNFLFNSRGNLDSAALITVFFREPSGIGQLKFIWYSTVDMVSLFYEDATGTFDVDFDVVPSTAIYGFHNTEDCNISIGFMVESGPNSEAHIYINGEDLFSFIGTSFGMDQSTAIFAIKFMETYPGLTGMYPTNIDDLYVDYGSGNSFEVPEALRFGVVRPSAPGANTDWSPLSGANWQNIDEQIGDDSIYNYTNVPTDLDTFDMSAFTLPADSVIQAAIPTVRAQAGKTGSPLYIRLASKNGISYDYSSDQDLKLGFTYLWKRYTTEAAGGAWSEADVNSSEFGYELRA